MPFGEKHKGHITVKLNWAQKLEFFLYQVVEVSKIGSKTEFFRCCEFMHGFISIPLIPPGATISKFSFRKKII